MKENFYVEFTCSKNTQFFTSGKEYRAKRIFPQWPWMVMAWDNQGIGRYIHNEYFGEYKEI
jgi:hypothetical protein